MVDDRRDRGRVDRGVTRSRRSRSPAPRRPESDREPKTRDRSPFKSRSAQHTERPRDRSHERRRRYSRSPIRDSREEVRERNKGRELLDTRGSDKPKRTSTHHSPSSGRRRKSRSPSPTRSHHKKSKRRPSRSPSRLEESASSASRPDKKRRTLSPAPPKRRSDESRSITAHTEDRHKHHRGSGLPERSRGRSPSPRQDHRHTSRHGSSRPREDTTRHTRSPSRQLKPRQRSPFDKEKDKDKDREQKRPRSSNSRQKTPDVDHYEPSSRSVQRSPSGPRGSKENRIQSPNRDRESRPSRDEYRPSKPKQKGGKHSSHTASGANSIEVKGTRAPAAASGANSIEVKSDKMNNRPYYSGQPAYNPNQQMQAAFPLKPQYNQGPQVDPRQYSQSPQHHLTPNSYHSSPQAQSPYSAGRGGWGGAQYSPQQYVTTRNIYDMANRITDNFLRITNLSNLSIMRLRHHKVTTTTIKPNLLHIKLPRGP